ncbi:hypothetical protein A0J61_05854 [Choanephora cucurbitarum]|uniref:Uncharacterized protein n=1 Tax=Choanephora cucurbitarum TaxID=101091 RepID=A0A1C7NAG3_9FUNG|nr:hypothetical protein A0J61_05854 [Choanephora cucurbitarum]
MNGSGSLMNGNGEEHHDFAMETDSKLPEKAAKVVAMKTESSTKIVVGDVDEMSVKGAAKQLGIPPLTAQMWFKKGDVSLKRSVRLLWERLQEESRSLGDLQSLIYESIYKAGYMAAFTFLYTHPRLVQLKNSGLFARTLISRITDVCNKVLLSDLKGFFRHFMSMFEDCLNKKPT